MSLIIGLTGGIGCGKSTVADLFASKGAGIIDTDAISHDLTRADGDAIAAISATFGSEYIADDGALNRSKMRNLIFADRAAKMRLELLLHPRILEQTRIQLQQQQPLPYNIVVIPLLAASPDFQQLVRRVLVVDCAENHQIERVIKRSGIGISEVRAIIAQQTPRAEILRLADDVIRNDGSLENLAGQVAFLHDRYRGVKNDI